jgi:hypothetical protein
MKRHFRVIGALDGTGALKVGKVTIYDGFFEVRPLRRRRVYALPLSTVADFVCKRIILAEHAEKRAAKKARRRPR